MAVLNGRTRWPTVQEFVRAGEGDLYLEVQRNGGAATWAARLEVAFAAEPSDRPRRRADEPAPAVVASEESPARETNEQRRARKIREIEAFCVGREFLPTYSDFRAVDRLDLYEFMHSNGGVQEWSRRLGLKLTPLQDQSLYGLDRAIADGRRVQEQFGRIPGATLLQRAGYGRLWTFIRRDYDGDRDAFSQLCR